MGKKRNETFIPDGLFDYARSDTQRETLQAIRETGSIRAAARKLGKNYTAAQDSYRIVVRWATMHGFNPGYDMTHPVPEGYYVKGVSTYYGQDGEVRGQWVKSQADLERQQQIIREMVEEMCASVTRVTPKKAPSGCKSDLMVTIPWGDPHFGMYAWAEETGNDFDLDIARRDLCAAVSHLVGQSPPASRCLIANLGDMFHADNLAGVTTKSGNVLDMDTRLPKVIRVGVSAVRACIETALEKHETVEIVNAIGNHDEVLSQALSIMLANVYEDEPRVVVHDQPTRRHYVRHGKVLIGVTHGDRTKDSDLPGIMATERPKDWGEAEHRYFWRGHHHQDSVQEFNGCKVEQFRTLAARDAYAVAGGWLSGRDMKCLVMHSEFGEVARYTVNPAMLG